MPVVDHGDVVISAGTGSAICRRMVVPPPP
jgi:hypothetical protein